MDGIFYWDHYYSGHWAQLPLGPRMVLRLLEYGGFAGLVGGVVVLVLGGAAYGENVFVGVVLDVVREPTERENAAVVVQVHVPHVESVVHELEELEGVNVA